MTTPAAENPFVGLRPFKTEESLLFFGRDEQIIELLDKLHKFHFVAVIGGSGTGKSSLMKAGLIPALQAGYLVNDADLWDIMTMRPGQNPLYELALAISDPAESAEADIQEILGQIQEKGVDALTNVLKLREQQDHNFFLLVDQFEEIFRFSMNNATAKQKDDANDFVQLLLELAGQQKVSVYVLITMRSDFIGDCIQFNGLPQVLNQSQYLVPRLTRMQIKSVIEGPVKLFGAKINPALTSRLINDVQIVNDELPLLQHLLMRIWDHEKNTNRNGELDLGDYEAMGGIQKTLYNQAEEAFANLSADEKLRAKKIFQALTTVDESGRKIRRAKKISELEHLVGTDRSVIMTIINRFIEANRSFLEIRSSEIKEDALIDISHESLIRQWTRLTGWVDDEAQNSKMLNRLEEARTLYSEKKKDLLSGNELQMYWNWYQSFKPTEEWAIQYTDKYTQVLAYLKKSEGRRRTGSILLKGGMILAVAGVMLFALWKWDDKKQKELKTKYEFLLFSAEKAKAEDNRLAVLLYTAAAAELFQTTDSIIQLNQPSFYLNNILDVHSEVEWASFSKNADTVFAYADNNCLLWDPGKNLVLNRISPASPEFPTEKEKRLVEENRINLFERWGVDSTGRGMVINLEWGTPVKVPRNLSAVYGSELSHDGKTMMIWGHNKDSMWTTSVWNLNSGEQISIPLIHRRDIYGAAFSNDDSRLLTWSQDSTVRLWNQAPDAVIQSADKDLPATLLYLQAKVLTGAEIDNTTKTIQSISLERWKILFNLWLTEAKMHFSNCTYRKANYWGNTYGKE